MEVYNFTNGNLTRGRTLTYFDLYLNTCTCSNCLILLYETIFLTTKDKVQILAYFIKQPNDRVSSTPTMVYFHGNAGNIGHQLNNAQCCIVCVVLYC